MSSTTSWNREYTTYIGETWKLDLIEPVKRVERGIAEDHIPPIWHFFRGKRRDPRQHRIEMLLILREQRILLRSNPDHVLTSSQSLTKVSENPKNRLTQ